MHRKIREVQIRRDRAEKKKIGVGQRRSIYVQRAIDETQISVGHRKDTQGQEYRTSARRFR